MTARASRRGLAIGAVLGAMALVVLDAGMINVALPAIGAVFGVEPATAILVASVYQLALLMTLLPVAHVAERLGYRPVFVAGVALFAAAAALASIAPTFPLLVVARFLQGLGGAAILALGIALLRFALGSERLGSAIGWNALNVALCAAAGPALGALFLTIADWRWLLVGNLPLALLVLIASRALPVIPRSGRAFDVAAILLYAGGAALLFLAFQLLLGRPALAAGLATLSLVGLAFLVRRELPKASPLIPLDLLRRRPFRLAVTASTCCFAAVSAGQLALPFYLQLGLSSSALATGAVLACWPIAVALTSRGATWLAERYNPALLCASGAALLSAGLLSASVVPAQAGAAWLGLGAVACGMGFGLFQVPNNRNLFLVAAAERSAAAGGMQGTARLAGQTSGSLLVTMLFQWFPIPSAPRLALAVAAAFALAAALISLGMTARFALARPISRLRNRPPCDETWPIGDGRGNQTV